MLRPIALLGLVLMAQAQDQPTFRAGVRLVQVDVVVRNKNGPVQGLKKEDFTLLDEGKPQQIALFSFTGARSLQPSSAPLPPGTVSNRLNRQGEPISTATILLIDRLNTPITSQIWANRKVLQFLQKHGDRDRLGIYVLGTNLRAIQDLTDDPARLARAAKSVKPQDAKPLSSDVPAADPTGDATTDRMVADSLTALEDFVVANRVRTTKDALIAIARHLAKVPGRKNLIWISSSFPLLTIRPHEVIDFSREVEEASRALNDANVAVYPVDARGLMGSPMGNADQPITPVAGGPPRAAPPRPTPVGPDGIDTMNTLAGLTGGKAYYNTNGIDDSMQKASEDAELTYTLGFYPSEEAFDEKFHKLAVKVDQKAAEVRFRKGYFAAKISPGSQADSTAINQLLQDPLNATALGITVAATADPAQPANYNVHAVVDLHDIHLEHQNDKWVGTLVLSFFMEGAKTARNVTRKLDIPDAQLAASLEKGVEVNDTARTEGGSGNLRVVALDPSTGAAGSLRVALGRQ